MSRLSPNISVKSELTHTHVTPTSSSPCCLRRYRSRHAIHIETTRTASAPAASTTINEAGLLGTQNVDCNLRCQPILMKADTTGQWLKKEGYEMSRTSRRIMLVAAAGLAAIKPSLSDESFALKAVVNLTGISLETAVPSVVEVDYTVQFAGGGGFGSGVSFNHVPDRDHLGSAIRRDVIQKSPGSGGPILQPDEIVVFGGRFI